MMTQHFNNDFEYLTQRVFINKEPTVFTRYGDGELALMTGRSVPDYSQASIQDKWQAPSYKTKLGKDLGNTLKNNYKEWFHGISCNCCDPRAKHIFLENLKMLGVELQQITYSNLFINANYQKFLNVCSKIDEDVVVIGNKEGVNKTYPFMVKEFIAVEDDCVNFWENNKDIFLKELSKLTVLNNTLFLISAGPMSEPIIEFLWNNNKTNRYIDVGSSLDEYTKSRKTRPYMIANQPYHSQVCIF